MVNYVFQFTIPAGTPADEPASLRMKLTTGTLKRVDIGFPFGCRGTAHICLYRESLQMLPFVEGQDYAWDDIMQTFDVSIEIDDTAPDIIAYGWSPTARFQHQITLAFGVQPAGELTETELLLGKLITG